MTARTLTNNYALNHDKALEGAFVYRVPGEHLVGTLEGFTNVGTVAIPFGRVVVYDESTYDGGVKLPTNASSRIAGASFYQAQFERNDDGTVGIPVDYSVTLARKAVVYFLAETNIAKTDTLYYRGILNGTPGANEALGRIGNTANGATITNKALTSNVATLTSVGHGFTVGQVVTVADVDSVFNGTYTITAVTADTFSYAKTNANVASGVATGTVARCAVLTGAKIVTEAIAGSLVAVEFNI